MTDFILALPILLFSVVAHEYAHAWTAYREGDDTAHARGRLTLNPLPHIDPMMSVVFPAALFWLSSLAGHPFTFGAARPVPVDPRNFRHARRGQIVVASAGIVANVALALACAALFALAGVVAGAVPAVADAGVLFQRMFRFGVGLNFLLAVFNLLPVPPLDGSHLVAQALPPGWGRRYRRVARYGVLLLLAAFFVPGVWDVVLWPVDALSGATLGAVRGFAIPAGSP